MPLLFLVTSLCGTDSVFEDPTLVVIGNGYQFVEGPVWIDGGLVFSDIPGDTLFRWEGTERPKVYVKPSRQTNGNALDRKGLLLSCRHQSRDLVRKEGDRFVPLAERFEGRRLNSPNDLCVAKDGTIYFTDPPYGVHEKDRELDYSGVYSIEPSGKLQVWDKSLPRPNGIALSPDENTLYVSDSQTGAVYSYPRSNTGAIGAQRLFARLEKVGPGVPDGLRVDAEGRVFATGPGGVHVLDPQGNALTVLRTPETAANVAFGGKDGRTLFTTTQTSVVSVRTKVPGNDWRR